jgi:hypothetical protein
MSHHPAIDAILRSGTATDSQTLELRRAFYGDMIITEEEANSLFKINATCTQQSKAWSEFFIESIGDFIIHQQKPRGYVDETNARWLMQNIEHDGKLDSVNELELLISVFEKAKSVPESLIKYALDQVKHAVLSGEGPLRSGQHLEPGIVSEADVGLLRRILYAYGSGNNIGITTTEAEILFDINDATIDSANHPSWNILFAQAIANHLMMAQGHQALSRDVALRQEQWMDKPTFGTAGSLSDMVKGLRAIYTQTAKPKLEEKIAQSEIVTAFEAEWLINRINRDGKMSDAERAVLTFIKQNASEIHPSLQQLLSKVA